MNGSASSDEDSSAGTNDDIASFEWFEDSGAPSERLLGTGESISVVLPLGSHRITLKVTDTAGASSTAEVPVRVVDTTPPAMSVQPSPRLLWPPNHRMVPVSLSAEASDLCDPAPRIALVEVTSSEPDDPPGGGDGRTLNDIQEVTAGAASTKIRLCAERAESGAGRIYTVSYIATDSSGNSRSGKAPIVVPHTARISP